MSPNVEFASLVLLGSACLFVLVASIVMASRLTAKRLVTLEALHTLLGGKKTYIVSLVIVLNELYSSYKYQQPINVTALLEALGLSTIRASVGQVQKQQESVKEDTSLVVATMPIAPVTPKRVDAIPPPKQIKDSS